MKILRALLALALLLVTGCTQEKEAEKRPAPEHASAPQRSEAATPLNTVPDLNLDEWVGEPTPIIKPLPVSAPLPAPEETPLTLEPEQKVSPKKRDNAPLTLAPTDDAPLTLTDQTDKADEPLMLGTPLPDKKSSLSNDVLMLDEPLGNQPELSLAGLGLEPQAEVINLPAPVRKPTPAQPAEKDAPIPDLFGDARPAPQPGPRSLLDEAACLAPCGQGSRPTASTNELAIDDIVELGVPVAPVIQPATEKDTALPEPQEAPLPPVLPQETAKRLLRSNPVQAFPKHRNRNLPFPQRTDRKGLSRMLSRRARHLTKPSVPCLRNWMKLWSAPSRANNRATRRWSAKPPPISDVWPKPTICACWTIRPAALKRSPAPAIWTKSCSSCRIWFPPSTGTAPLLKKRSGTDSVTAHSRAERL